MSERDITTGDAYGFEWEVAPAAEGSGFAWEVECADESGHEYACGIEHTRAQAIARAEEQARAWCKAERRS